MAKKEENLREMNDDARNMAEANEDDEFDETEDLEDEEDEDEEAG